MGISKKPYKGTRDLFPPEKRIHDFILKVMAETAQSFGYEHYDGPLLEEVQLYKAKSGEELINEQIYSFKDRGERFVAIRPEMTPTLARMIAQIHRQTPKPIRWFSIPNLMRYERPQKGRLREHWQFNCDIFGAPEKHGEFEALLLAKELLENFGATKEHFEILINDRALIDALFNKITSQKEIQYKLYKILDKSKKVTRQSLEKEISQLNLDSSSRDLFFNYIDTKNAEDIILLLENNHLSEEIKHFKEFYSLIQSNDLINYIKFDPAIVRGLDYYTGIVFELFDKNPDNRRAICGGGSYQGLLQIFGEEPLPGVGFGLGDVTLKDFLETHKLLPDFSLPKNNLFISFQTPSGFFDLQNLAQQLRKSNAHIIMSLEEIKIKKVFKEAEKRGAQFILLYGEEEKSKKSILIKNLKTREQNEFKINDVSKILAHIQ